MYSGRFYVFCFISFLKKGNQWCISSLLHQTVLPDSSNPCLVCWIWCARTQICYEEQHESHQLCSILIIYSTGCFGYICINHCCIRQCYLTSQILVQLNGITQVYDTIQVDIAIVWLECLCGSGCSCGGCLCCSCSCSCLSSCCGGSSGCSRSCSCVCRIYSYWFRQPSL